MNRKYGQHEEAVCSECPSPISPESLDVERQEGAEQSYYPYYGYTKLVRALCNGRGIARSGKPYTREQAYTDSEQSLRGSADTVYAAPEFLQLYASTTWIGYLIGDDEEYGWSTLQQHAEELEAGRGGLCYAARPVDAS